MLFSPRISLKQLANLCRRLSTSLAAGINARNVWAREAERAQGVAARWRFRAIRDAVNRGSGMREALDETGDYFPTLFREMVHVGEETGKLSEVFRQLTANYEHQLQLRRNFLAAIAWPGMQFAMAVAIFGFLIWT